MNQIARPANADEVTDATVLNGIIEEWKDLNSLYDVPRTFPDALREFLEDNVDLVRDGNTEPKLRQRLAREVTTIQGWLEEFSDMYAKLGQEPS